MEKIKILVADGMSIISKTLKESLETMDNIKLIDIASSVEEEYNKIKELRPDIVITDIILKRESNIDMIKEIQSSKEKKTPAFVIITPDREAEKILKKEGIEYFDILYKPFKYDLVKEVIGTISNKKLKIMKLI